MPFAGDALKRSSKALNQSAMYLLDTNVISELRRPRPHGAVIAWLESVADIDLHVCAVSLGEIQAGIEITREQNEAKALEIERWADLMAASYNVYCPWMQRSCASGQS